MRNLDVKVYHLILPFEDWSSKGKWASLVRADKMETSPRRGRRGQAWDGQMNGNHCAIFDIDDGFEAANVQYHDFRREEMRGSNGETASKGCENKPLPTREHGDR